MTDKDLDSRIDGLPEEKRAELENRVEPFEEELEEELFEQHKAEIENQIRDDETELDDFNVVVSGFLEQDGTEYSFIRTEPLIHEQDKNFDVLVAAPRKGIAVLVEIERSLLDRLPSKLNKFASKVDVVDSNSGSLDVDNYFESILSVRPDTVDYVLSSKALDPSDIENTARAEAELNLEFIAWMLASHGSTCRITDYTIKQEQTSAFDGHADAELKKYISNTLEKEVEKQDYISFVSSSSRYLKLKHMSIALVNRYQRGAGEETFNYEDWKRLFEGDVDLYNYIEEEKETLFKRYIKYAREVGVVSLEVDNGSLHENEYRVVSRATRDQEKLLSELMSKMTEARMEEDFERRLREKKREIVTELEQDHATAGTTLSDFADGEGP